MSPEQRRGLARAALTGTLLFVATGAHAAPTGPQVASGSAAITGLGTNSLTVTNSANAIINWQGFSIGAGERANFVQPSASSAVLNRVVGPNISTIAGQLLSNGRVFLTNPSGVLITSGAQINAASFTATTSAISNADFLAGNTQSGLGSFVTAEGLLTVSGGDLSISTSGISITGNVDGGGNFSVGTPGTVDLSGSINSGNLILATPFTSVSARIITTAGSVSVPGTIVLVTDSNVSTGGTLTVAGTAGTISNLPATLTTNSPVGIVSTGQSLALAGGAIPSGLSVTTAGGVTNGGSNIGTITLTSHQGSTGSFASAPALVPTSTPVQTASGSPAAPGATIVATANVGGIPQSASTGAAMPRAAPVGATISLQKREPMF